MNRLHFFLLFVFLYLFYLFVSCLSFHILLFCCLLLIFLYPGCPALRIFCNSIVAAVLSNVQLNKKLIDLTAQAQQAQHHKHSTSSTIDLTAQDKPCRNTTLFHWICKTQATLCIFKCLVFMQILNSTGLVALEIDGMIILQETVCLYKVFFLFWINVILVFYLFNGSIKYERESIKANRWIWMRG